MPSAATGTERFVFKALGAHDGMPEIERLAREEPGVGDCRMPRAEDRARFTDAWAESAGKAGWEPSRAFSALEIPQPLSHSLRHCVNAPTRARFVHEHHAPFRNVTHRRPLPRRCIFLSQ